MQEIRLAQEGEILRQKEIWKLCFGDSDQYIDLYYAARYKENETLLMLEGGEIVSMLTMLPNKTITTNRQSFNSTMLYAIATHPEYQHRGYASQLIDFAHQYLNKIENHITLVVPAEGRLFDYYRRLGYGDGFYIREILFDSVQQKQTFTETISYNILDHSIKRVSAQEYNQKRKAQLSGRLYVSYTDEDIAYQQKLSQKSGADLYSLDFEDEQGCAVIERLNPDKVMVKEILISEKYLAKAIEYIARLHPAKDYIVRVPAFSGMQLSEGIRPFAMYRTNRKNDFQIKPEEAAYLGIAFD